MNEFSRVLSEMLAASGKSLYEVTTIGGVDLSYGRKLLTGEKTNPSYRTIFQLYLGLVFDSELYRRDPTMVHGLTELLESAAMTAAASTDGSARSGALVAGRNGTSTR